MDSTLSGRPLCATLSRLATSDHSDKELHELLSWLGGGGTRSALKKAPGDEDFLEADTDKEDS